VSSLKVAAFGRAVRRCRNEQGITHEEVAKRSGDRGPGSMDGRYVRRVEEIERPLNHAMAMSTPTLLSAFLIAKGLGVPLAKLVEGIEDEVEP
jgi:transcriptional regulator with XRE-family HTH domain